MEREREDGEFKPGPSVEVDIRAGRSREEQGGAGRSREEQGGAGRNMSSGPSQLESLSSTCLSCSQEDHKHGKNTETDLLSFL